MDGSVHPARGGVKAECLDMSNTACYPCMHGPQENLHRSVHVPVRPVWTSLDDQGTDLAETLHEPCVSLDEVERPSRGEATEGVTQEGLCR
jgi:hypothetical protein